MCGQTKQGRRSRNFLNCSLCVRALFICGFSRLSLLCFLKNDFHGDFFVVFDSMPHKHDWGYEGRARPHHREVRSRTSEQCSFSLKASSCVRYFPPPCFCVYVFVLSLRLTRRVVQACIPFKFFFFGNSGQSVPRHRIYDAILVDCCIPWFDADIPVWPCAT